MRFLRFLTRYKAGSLGGARQGGFSLIELLVSLVILTVLMTAVLQLFQSSTEVAATQLEQADLQQAVRVALQEVVRQTRLLGRGGLLAARPRAAAGESWNDVWCTAGNCDDTQAVGLALRLDTNVPVGYNVVKGDGTSPQVLAGTDVLTVRGVFASQVYLARYSDAASFTLTAGPPDTNGDPTWTGGQVVIEAVTPIGDVPQDLSFFVDIKAAGRPEAVLLMSPFNDEVFGVGKFDPGASSLDAVSNKFTLAFSLDGSDKHAKVYRTASAGGTFPGDVLSQSRIGAVGILEEYRYYIRTGAATGFEGIAGVANRQRLSRTRTYPGMEGIDANYPLAANPTHVDLADDVIDFQVALGFDQNGNGLFEETPDGAGDEWIGNNVADAIPPAGNWGGLGVARLSMIARSRAPHRNHQSQQILRLEDRDHSAGDPSDPAHINSFESRLHLRFTLQSLVEMRNL